LSSVGEVVVVVEEVVESGAGDEASWDSRKSKFRVRFGLRKEV